MSEMSSDDESVSSKHNEDDDDDTDSELSSLEDEEVKPGKRKQKQSTKVSKKRRRREGAAQYFLDEATVDDEEDEEEDDDDDIMDRFVRKEDAAELAAAARLATEAHRSMDSRRRLENLINEADEEKLEEYYKRYDDAEVDTERFGEGEDMAEDIVQQKLLPGVNDPNLWLVKCRIGEEKQAVLQLMRKMISSQYSGNPLQIKSALVKEGLKGYIYIEAYKQTHVKQALEGIRSLSMGQYNQLMVPVKEMPDVLRVKKNRQRLTPGQWVRLKRGMYHDDLAQIYKIRDAENSVILKLVPRIDYKRLRGALRNNNPPAQKKPEDKTKKRLPQAFFDPEKIRAIGGEWTIDDHFKVFEGGRYDRDGFLYKLFNLNIVLADGVKPSIAELERFKETPETIVLNSAMKKSMSEMEHNFQPGDVVQVVKGELSHLQGHVLSVEGNKVTVQPSHSELKEPLAFNADDLSKHFNEGDHVKVLSGPHENETGLVIKVSKHEAIVWSDVTNTEMKVVPKLLQLCQERATGVDSSGHYMFGDLVELAPKSFGVVVRLSKDHLEILCTNGKVVTKKQNEVLRRRSTRFVLATDALRNQMQVKDVVIVTDGPQTGMQGEIRHIAGQHLFLYSRMYPDNGGIFVVRTRQVNLRGGSTANSGGTGNPVNTPAELIVPQSPRLTGGMGSSGASATSVSHDFKVPQNRGPGSFTPGRGGGAGRGGRFNSERSMVGKTVRIIKGPLKGKIGIIKDVRDQQCSLELHSEYKTVLVKRESIAEIDGQGRIVGARLGGSSTLMGSSVTAIGSRTADMTGGQTPLAPGATPQTPSAWMFGGSGSRTPSMSHGAMTPMYGGQTPHFDGSRTPYYRSSQTPHSHDDGSRTPRLGAFNPAAATPHASFGSSSSSMASPMSSRDDGTARSATGLYSDNPFLDSPHISSSHSHYSDYLAQPSASLTPLAPGSVTPMLPGMGSLHPSPMTSALDRDDYSSMISPSIDRSGLMSTDISGGASSSSNFYSPRDAGSGVQLDATSAQAVVESSEDLERLPRAFVKPYTGVLVPETVVDKNAKGRRMLRGVIKEVPPSLADDDGSDSGDDGDLIVTVFVHLSNRRYGVPINQIYKAIPIAGDKVRILSDSKRFVLGHCLSVDNNDGVVQFEGNELNLIRLNEMVPYCAE